MDDGVGLGLNVKVRKLYSKVRSVALVTVFCLIEMLKLTLFVSKKLVLHLKCFFPGTFSPRRG